MTASVALERRTALALNGVFAVRVIVALGAYGLMARRFGTSPDMDAFWVAVTPTLIALHVVEAAGVGAAVTFLASQSVEPAAGRRSAVAGFLTALLTLFVVLGTTSALMAEEIVSVLGAGLPPDARDLAVALVPLSSIALVVGPWSLLCLGLLQGNRDFFVASGIALLPHVVVVTGLALGLASVPQLAWCFTGGHVLAAIVAAVRAWRTFGLAGVVPRFARLGRAWSQFLPLLAGAILVQTIWLVERSLASQLEPGSISALSYALRIVTVLGGLVAVGFETTVMTNVAWRHASGDHVEGHRVLRRALAFVAVLAVPPGLLLVLAGHDLVELLFLGGAFGQVSVSVTAAAMIGYFGVFVYSSIGRVVMSGAIGRQRSGAVLAAALAALVSYATAAPFLAQGYGVVGLAAAASLSFGIATLLYAVDLARH